MTAPPEEAPVIVRGYCHGCRNYCSGRWIGESGGNQYSLSIVLCWACDSPRHQRSLDAVRRG